MTSDRQFVTALSRGLEILACFTPQRPVLTNGELSRLTGLACSSVSRLTHTLIKLGYLDYDSDEGTYRLSLRVLAFQPAALAGVNLCERVLPRMRELAERTNAVTLLCMFEGDGLLVVQCAVNSSSLSDWRFLGSRYPVSGSASGRAYMASCNSHEVGAIGARLSNGSEVRAAEVISEAEQAQVFYRTDGYVASIGAVRPGTNYVGVPLRMQDLRTRMTLACGGSAHILPRSRLRDQVAPLMIETAADIERAFADNSRRSRPATRLQGRDSAGH